MTNKLIVQKIFISCFILVSCFMFHVSFIHAQSHLSLTAIPPRLEIEAVPGKIITKTVKVRNDSTVEIIISINVKDYIVSDETGTPIQLELSSETSANRWSASSWIQVSPSRLVVGPSEIKAMVVTIITPEDALPGGHYAMIIHSPDASASLDQSGSAIVANVGTLLYLKVPGQIRQEAKVKIFSAPEFQEQGPVNFQTVITNLSDIHITPVGSIKITNWLGQKSDELILKNSNIFPYASREFQNTLDRKWLFGRYKANLLASFGTSGDFVVDSLYFWVIPWRLVILVIVALTIIVLLISLLAKNPDGTSQNSPKESESELKTLKNKYKDRR